MSLYRNDPDWLNSLRGNSPLLGRSELEYIDEVRRSIIKASKSTRGFHGDRHLENKLSVMKDNFVKVVEYLKENSESKEYFLRYYPEWRCVRNLTVLKLKQIANCVNEDSQNCSISRGVGSTVSLIGGLMCLASGNGALRVLGASLMGLGTVTSAGTSAVEMDLLRKKIKEAEQIIQKDRDYSERLWNWISDVSYIQESLDIIRSINVDVSLKKVANDFHACYKMKRSPDELKMILKSLKVSPMIVKDICDVVGILIATSMLYDRHRHLFTIVLETYKCKKMLNMACDLVMTTLKVSSSVNVGKSSELTTLQKSKIFTGIALDAINIILASGGAKSSSKEAAEIVKAAEKLEKEADVFKKLYDAVD